MLLKYVCLHCTVFPPGISINITTSLGSSDDLIVGSSVKLICIVRLDETTNTTVNVTTMWYKNGSLVTNTSNIMVTSAVLVSMRYYQSVVSFDSVTIEDSGDYECIVTVESTDPSLNILDAEITASSVSINISGSKSFSCISLYMMLCL